MQDLLAFSYLMQVPLLCKKSSALVEQVLLILVQMHGKGGFFLGPCLLFKKKKIDNRGAHSFIYSFIQLHWTVEVWTIWIDASI